MGQKILVTGGTGYIGSHTVVELQQAGYEVVIIDNLSNSNDGVLDGIEAITGIRPAFVEGDCTDIETLRRLFADHKGIKGIINFAASKAVGESVQKPLLYYRNNLNTLINLLELMPEYGVEGIVFSSSCTVYGEPDRNPIDETAPIKPATSPYGNTKQISEEIITDYVASGAPIKSIILIRGFLPLNCYRRTAFLIRFQLLQRKHVQHPAGKPDLHPAAPVPKPPDPGLQRIQLLQQRAAVLIQINAAVRGQHPARRARKQFRVQIRLQIMDHPAQSLRCDKKLLRRLIDALFLVYP